MPLKGLNPLQKAGAAIALREVADATKVQLTAPKQPGHTNYSQSVLPYDKVSIHGVQLRTDATTPNALFDSFGLDTKLPKIVPSGSAGNITYSFGLYTPKFVDGQSIVDGPLTQIRNQPFEHEIFSLEDKDAFTAVENVSSIATSLGEKWDYSILQASVPSVKDGAKDATLYAELWTDYASAGKSDYMVGGWWLLVPDNPAGDYRFGAFAKGENLYARWDPMTGQVKPAVTGEATYKGPAAGLFVSSENGMVSIQRLLGKVTLTADFQTTSEPGTIEGEIHSLTLDGESARGEILLPKATLTTNSINSLRFPLSTVSDLNKKGNIGNINSINYQGDWAGTTLGDSSGTDQPTGIVGVVGGSGGGNSFVASFGAKKVEDE